MMTCLKHMRPMENSDGFTLLELLVVMGIISLVVVTGLNIGSPNLERLGFRSAGRDIASYLRTARSEAIAGNLETTFSIDLAKGVFWNSETSKRHHIPTDVRITLLTARSELLTRNVGRIRFYPNGSATGGTLFLRQREKIITVNVHWLTGRVKIKEFSSDAKK